MLILFNGDNGGEPLLTRVKKVFYGIYRDMLFPIMIILLCLLGTFVLSKTLKVKNVFGSDAEKYIVIIIDDYGYNGEGTDDMLKLGVPVTAAVMPGMASSEEDAKKYYEAGFDVILHQPMEPYKGKGSWLGPFGLTNDLSDEQVYQTVSSALDTVKLAVGINNHMGSKIMENERIISQVMRLAGEKDLIFVDSKTTGKSVARELAKKEGIRYYERDIFLDSVKTAKNTRNQLLKAAEVADKKGYAIVIGHVGTAGGKTTVQGIKDALPELQGKGYKFITISDLDIRVNMGLSKK